MKKTFYLLTILTLSLLFVMPVHGQAANGIDVVPLPIWSMKTNCTGTYVDGALSVTYQANGRPVILINQYLNVFISAESGNETVTTLLPLTQNGTYTYNLHLNVSGAALAIIPAYSLHDAYNEAFPSSDTLIAAFTILPGNCTN